MMMSGTDQSGEIKKHLNNSTLVTDILQEHTSDNSFYIKIIIFPISTFEVLSEGNNQGGSQGTEIGATLQNYVMEKSSYKN